MSSFIDFHVHPPVAEFVAGPLRPFRDDLPPRAVEEVADHYRQRDGIAVLLGLDAESTTRERPFSAADVAAMVAAAPDVFVGLGSVDPARGAKAVAGIHEVARFGLAGLAFDPVVQGFDPAERPMLHLWDNASDHRLIVLFHTGATRLGRGQPGGAGLRLVNGDPRSVDVVASQYPEMPVIIAHSGRLWRDEALAIASHKKNVWLNLVAAPPSEYVQLLDADEPAIDPERLLFGSSWVFSDLDEQLKEWELVDARLKQQVLYENAARLLASRDS